MISAVSLGYHILSPAVAVSLVHARGISFLFVSLDDYDTNRLLPFLFTVGVERSMSIFKIQIITFKPFPIMHACETR